MGYMDISLVGSDMASDAASDTIDAMLKVLEDTFKQKNSKWNTPGPVNAALILDELVFPIGEVYHCLASPKFYKFVNRVIRSLEGKLKTLRKGEWEDEEGRQYHIESYQRLLDRCKEFMDKRAP